MKAVLDRIAAHARQHPERPAITDGEQTLDYRGLQAEIERLAELLDRQHVALLLGNGLAWATLDLAILQHGGVCIPMPPFFSAAQMAHVLRESRPGLVITDQPERLRALLPGATPMPLTAAGQVLTGLRLPGVARDPFPAHTAKLTYTSGTTGRPKGVCLSGTAMAQVAASLSEALQANAHDRALSLLPLATLLENIGGLYAPLYSGALACLPDLKSCGMHGSSGVDPTRLLEAMRQFAPTTTILVPGLLKALVAAGETGDSMPASLRFAALGGAPTAPALIQRARRLGLPVYEGYGLSEACSVVSLNLPAHDLPGSVGRPLPHARVRIAPDGEVLVAGTLFSGYLGQPGLPATEWRTGDLGRIDADGNLFITGRRRTTFATSYGRNVAPEWVEGELLASPLLHQAVVFGAARPSNVALLVVDPRADTATIDALIDETNQRLPDYARVRHWLLADAPFTLANGLARSNGTVDRDAVARRYARQIEHLYQEEDADALV